MTCFTERETIQLIEIIKKQPALYNSDHEAYKDDYTRTLIWKSIGETMKKDDNECRKKWKLLKDSYNRFKRTSSKKIVPPRNSKWKLYARLGFLEDANFTNSSEVVEAEDEESLPMLAVERSLSQDSAMDHKDDLGDCASSMDESLSSTSHEKIFEVKQSVINKDQANEDDFSYQARRDRQIAQQETIVMQQQAIDDTIASFANYVEVSLRKLSPRLKAMAKSEIFSVLTKYEIMDLNEETPSCSNIVLGETQCFPKIE